MDKKTRDLYKFLDDLTSEAKISAPKEFEVSKAAQKDSRDLNDQKYDHRNSLLKLVAGLSVASFVLLTLVTLLQMIIRIWDDEYVGISDAALNILAVSVFGQVIAVVGTIAYNVWKEPKT